LPGTVDVVRDTGLDADALDAADGVVTGAAVAVAETGTAEVGVVVRTPR
jgi:L-lactate dehydrogenase complex protein LldG